MRRFHLLRLPALLLALALVFAACGDDDKDDAKDTTTTSTTAPTSTTATTVDVKSDSAVAVALNDSILDSQQLQATMGLSAAPTVYQGNGTAPPPPQGPLSLAGVAKVFPSEAYKGLLEQGGAVVGANKSFLVPAGTSGYVVNILAIKFATAQGGGTFVTSSTDVAKTFGGAKVNAHPEVTVGVTPGAVAVVPPAAGAQTETVVIAALYSDGVYYLVSTTAAPGAVTDEVVIKILKGQDAKYQAKKSTIPAS
jgi:hypothetical protein